MTYSLISRSQDLLQRAQATDELSHRHHERMHNLLEERKEALQLMRQLLEDSETKKLEFVALESRVFEIVGRLVRGPNGHVWKKEFPDGQSASQFYQDMHGLVKWMAERARIAQTTPTDKATPKP